MRTLIAAILLLLAPAARAGCSNASNANVLLGSGCEVIISTSGSTTNIPGAGGLDTTYRVKAGSIAVTDSLDVNGNAQFGSGANKSTFTATGGLTVPYGIAASTFQAGAIGYGLNANPGTTQGLASSGGNVLLRANTGSTVYVQNAAGTTFASFDATNDILYGSVGVGGVTPCSTCTLHVAGGASVTGAFSLAESTTSISGAWTAWTPVSPSGCSGALTNTSSRYLRIGKTLVLNIDVECTSNATWWEITLPFSPTAVNNMITCAVRDNGVFVAGLGVIIANSSPTMTVYKDGTLTSAWTNSGVKRVICSGSVEIQ